MTEPHACPFCGSSMVLDKGQSQWSHKEDRDCIIGQMGVQNTPAKVESWNRRTVSAQEAALQRLHEAAKELHADMLVRAQAKMDVISGEQYRVVNAGNSAWYGFDQALRALAEGGEG